MLRRCTLVAVGTLILAACGSSPSEDTDAGVEAGFCCEIEVPTCDCFQIGGVVDNDGQCPTICDAEPDGWMTDESGECPILRFVGGTGSCFPVDAGPDAGN